MSADSLGPPPALPLPPPISAPPRLDHESLTAPSSAALAAPVGPGATPVVPGAPVAPVAPAAPPHQQYDPGLEPAIKQLLDQQAEIQARLAALLPQKFGPNIKLELDMLRHKLQVLRAYADDNRELPCPLA